MRLSVCPSSDPSQSDPDTRDFWFNMQALHLHLQREAELNPQASYYNVGIIKYQVGNKHASFFYSSLSGLLVRLVTGLCLFSSAVVSGPGPGSAAALSRVSAQRHGHPRVPGLPLLPRHGALHPADRRPGAAALGPHRHGPAVSAARLLVSTRARASSFMIV